MVLLFSLEGNGGSGCNWSDNFLGNLVFVIKYYKNVGIVV